MSEKPYTGTVTGMKQASKFLASEDLIGAGEVTLEITGVFEHTGETMQDGRAKDLFSISFAKIPKRMVLNATNRRTLAMAFGKDVKNWSGKKVGVYVQDGIRNPKGGETVTGLRIKADPDPALLKARRESMTGEAEK
jgi:hypothetical protein